ncbi:ATP-binding protein [Reinekea sp.]|jgi:uncharacterized protein (TIGR00290 family)|uniref:Dph6-related ATP pyrophosphatase n=1 Tax=Reinekea sp. TaxID=1970455 RepID=UPI003989FAAB
MAKRTFISWSTGKDSAWATYQLQSDPTVKLEGILCTVNGEHQRTAMHAVRLELLRAQAEQLALPLKIIEIPYPCSNEQYTEIMSQATEQLRVDGIEYLSFGDLYLEDIRQYRIDNLQGTGIAPIFPLWMRDTKGLASEIVNSGLRAIITCIDPKKLDASFAGREYDQSFLDDLPEGVDPCGENGEFHSFVFAGPMFKSCISIEVGETVARDGFVFADLLITQ